MPQEARYKKGVAKKYATDDIAVFWEPRLCIHVAECIRNLPQVFNPQARPWVAVDNASADAIAETIMKCPTGALRFERLDGAPQEPVPEVAEIRATRDGPLYVRGNIELQGPDGEPIRDVKRAALCRCGHSKNKPFCDDTHYAIGWKSE